MHPITPGSAEDKKMEKMHGIKPGSKEDKQMESGVEPGYLADMAHKSGKLPKEFLEHRATLQGHFEKQGFDSFSAADVAHKKAAEHHNRHHPENPISENRRDTGGDERDNHWIAGAIRHHGLLHDDLGVPQGQKIPEAKLEAALAGKYGPAAAKRARLAKTLEGFNK